MSGSMVFGSLALMLATVSVVVARRTERRRRAQVERMRATHEDLRAARVRALEVIRTKDALLASVSRDLRTPLNAVMGYTALLREDLKGSAAPGALADLRRIDAAARHLRGVVGSIIDLAEIDGCGGELELTRVDVAGAVGDAVALVHRDLVEGNIALVLDGPPDDVWISTDLGRLRVALVRLVSAAVTSLCQGRLVIRWRMHDDWLRVEIGACGRGASAVHQDAAMAMGGRAVREICGMVRSSPCADGVRITLECPDLEASEEAAVRRAM